MPLPALTLAHSPDADDVAMWWPLVGLDGSGPLVDTEGLRFELIAEDVEALNRRAIEAANAAPPPAPLPQAGGGGGYDITAISAHAYAHCAGLYRITSCGGSFGEGYGPKVVARARAGVRSVEDLRGGRVGVPGLNTTAFLVLSLMLGAGSFEGVEMPFAEIPLAVSRGEVTAGLLIHEAQLLLDRHALVELADLGAWWASRERTPLPLGLNVVRRDLDERLGRGGCECVSRVLQRAVAHARGESGASREFLRARAGDRPEWRDDALVERYLSMYVSDLTLDMGPRGREGLRRLLGEAARAGLCPDPGEIDVAGTGRERPSGA